MNILIVVATALEAQRLQDLPARVVVSGVGAAAAALATLQAVHAIPLKPDLVVSAGIAGAYPESGLKAGDCAVSSLMVQADLGARDAGRFLGLAELGLSILPQGQHDASFPAWDGAAELAALSGATLGPMLTLNTVTGSREDALELLRRYPGALTEGMEGAGVAHAALLAGIPALEVRGVSNPVGPRDRAAWHIPEALKATRHVLNQLVQQA